MLFEPTLLPSMQPPDYPTYSPNSQLVEANIGYHGGNVMLGTVKVYVIWYGDWSGSKGESSGGVTKGLIEYFLHHLGGSPWLNIQTSYTGQKNKRVSNRIKYAGSAKLPAKSLELTHSTMEKTVLHALKKNLFPVDPNAIYLLIPSEDISDIEGSCTNYCGFHTYTYSDETQIKWSFISNPSSPTCNLYYWSGCYYMRENTANANPAADAMVSTIAHELTETITDPDMQGWFDYAGYENADKCAWSFGQMMPGTYGDYYNANIQLGSKRFLVQQNWLNAEYGRCALAYPEF